MATSFILKVGGKLTRTEYFLLLLNYIFLFPLLLAPILGGLYFETFLMRTFKALYEKSALIPSLPKCYSAVVFINAIGF